MNRLERDVDPAYVEERRLAREKYARETASWGCPERCVTGVCDGDGSCVACGADQGQACLPRR